MSDAGSSIIQGAIKDWIILSSCPWLYPVVEGHSHYDAQGKVSFAGNLPESKHPYTGSVYIYTHTHTHIYIYMYMYIGVCVRILYGETTYDSVVSKLNVRLKN